MNNEYSTTTQLVLCGLFAALTAICSYINIPLGFTPIPMNLATLSVFLAGGLLGKRYGTLSIVVYVLMGAAGLPVFAGFQSGVGILAGPTGGFLIGYITAAFIIGFILQRANSFFPCIAGMTAGLAVCYAMGTGWFMFVTGSEFIPSVVACIVPFILTDIIKIIVAALLVTRLRKII